MSATTAPSLLIGGSADRSWDPVAAATTPHVVEIAGADHALYAVSWRTCLRALERVTDAVLEFAASRSAP